MQGGTGSSGGLRRTHPAWLAMGACGKRLGWGLRLPLLPPSALPPLQDSPEGDGRPSWAGRGPSEVAAGAPLTPAEVGEDVVHPEPGSGCAHLGVAVAEAAAAACRVVGLQVKGPWAASEMEAGHARYSARFRGSQLHQCRSRSLGIRKTCFPDLQKSCKASTQSPTASPPRCYHGALIRLKTFTLLHVTY